ncbi:MAG: hypothetical protein U1F58_18390 [Burkholderiales bacterium]
MPTRSRIAAILFAAACTTGAWAQGALVDVVEYYHAGLDHYFVSALPADIAALDSGTLKGWARTGRTFKAYDAPASGTSPVCRFYIPPAQGDSHFYSASPAECAEVAAKFPAFSYESPSVMHVGLPDAATGACSGGWTPVYRLWNNRADSNHRYTTDQGVRADMIARGYVAEGYGPEGVSMCAPTAGASFDLTFTSGSLLLMPGDTRDVYVVVTPRNGFAGQVALAIDGAAAGVTTGLAVATLEVKGRAVGTVLRLEASETAAPTAAKAVITIRAQGGSTAASTTLAVGVAPAGDAVATRMRTLASVEQRARELLAQNLPVASYLQAIAAYMAAQPEYAATGVDAETGNAWGRFRDGHLHILAENRAPDPALTVAVRSGPAPRAEPALPDTAKARLLHSFGPDFETQAPVDEMRAMLQSRGWNVRAGAEGDAHVGTLRGVSGDGFFYINTHGGRVEVDDPKEPEGKMYVITSSTVVDDDYQRVFKGDLDARRLAHLTARVRDRTVDVYDWTGVRTVAVTASYYGITYRFVDEYMTFAPGSVVLINACFSARNDPFVNAFHKKGAALVLGWDGYVNAQGAAYTAAPYFVDRMVGANLHKVKESPPQRPFPYDLVLKDMLAKGVERDSVTGAHLVAKPNPGLTRPPIFAPSILYVTVDEREGLLTLVGDFGTRLGKVTVGGVELAVAGADWTPTKITAQGLPFSGPGSNGDVIVEVNGVKSNARQLSDWVIPLAYDWTNYFDSPGLRVAGTGQLRFRADVGGYRTEPAAKPRYDVRYAALHRDGKLSLTASGSFAEQGCTNAASGSEVFNSPAKPGAELGPMLVGMLKLDAEGHRANLHLNLGSLLFTKLQYAVSGPGCDARIFPITPMFGQLDGDALFPMDASSQPQYSLLPALDLVLGSVATVPSIAREDKAWGGTIRIASPSVAPIAPPRDAPDAGK